MKATPSGKVILSYGCKWFWLVELFRLGSEFGEGRYKGDLADVKDAWYAMRYATEEEAAAEAAKMPAVEGCEWRATEHGFCEEA